MVASATRIVGGAAVVSLFLGGCSDDGVRPLEMADTLATTGPSGADTEDTGTTDPPRTTGPSTMPASTSTGGSTGHGSTGADAETTTTDGGENEHVIFVNFDGGEFVSGPDDATTNTAGVLSSSRTIDPYAGSAADRATILATIEADFAPFAVDVTDVRPSQGPYTMVVITPTNVVQASILGVGPLDCDNEQPSNVAFAFTDTDSTPALIGSVASGRLGATFGVENTDEPEDLSYGFPWPDDVDPRWLDECIETSSEQSCVEQHAQNCPEGRQNSYAALAAVFE